MVSLQWLRKRQVLGNKLQKEFILSHSYQNSSRRETEIKDKTVHK